MRLTKKCDRESHMQKKANQQKSGMIDTSAKSPTKRTAQASVEIRLSQKVFLLITQEGSRKGNVFETAKIAGIMAAKSTSSLIPMCHPIVLNKVDISFELNQEKHLVKIFSEVVCIDKTGVEMEALTAASIAALTFYDMMKYADKAMIITDLKLLKKRGGASGDFIR